MQRILNAENAFSSSLPSSFAKKKKRVSEIRKLPENINTLCTKLSFSKTEKFEKKNEQYHELESHNSPKLLNFN